MPKLRNRIEVLLIGSCLLGYAAGFLIFYPSVTTNVDESAYLRQAAAFAKGERETQSIDPLTGEKKKNAGIRYAPGTALIMAPFVRLFGWRGAYLVPFLSLVFAVWFMGAWLQDAGRSPLWAALFLTYPSIIVLARVGVSDVISLCFVTLSLFLFWNKEGNVQSFFSGFFASLSLLFRETNVLVYPFFFIGTIFRREKRAWFLVAGGVCGLALFFLAEYLVYGNLFKRSDEFRLFSLANILPNLPYYLIALMVFLPGGLAAVLLYKGERRPELILTTVAYLFFFLTWNSAVEGGFINKLVLHGPRFSLGIVPLVVFAMAEAFPRLCQKVLSRLAPSWQARKRALLHGIAAFWIIGAFMVDLGVHPLFYIWSKSRIAIINDIKANTEQRSVLVTNGLLTTKFINELYMDRMTVNIDDKEISADDINKLVKKSNSVYLVILYRTDSPFWKRKSSYYDEWINKIRESLTFEKVFQKRYSSVETLKIWKIID